MPNVVVCVAILYAIALETALIIDHSYPLHVSVTTTGRVQHYPLLRLSTVRLFMPLQ